MPEVKRSPATPDKSLSRSRCSLVTEISVRDFEILRPSGEIRSGARAPSSFGAHKQEER